MATTAATDMSLRVWHRPRAAVTLLAVESDSPLPEEAQAAREAWLNAGGVIHAATIPWPDDISLIIDGLLGTGLRSAPRDPVAALIHRANHHPAPVVALDIPSGLNAQTGATPVQWYRPTIR